MEKKLKRRIDVAAGRSPADLVIKGGQVINVFTEEILKGDVAIVDGMIAGVGGPYEGEEVIDAHGKYIAPGLIDGHVHIESAMVTPSQFAKTIVPRGTTTIIADPHEIANVCGLEGIQYMIDASENVPLDVFIMLPSCVPSTQFENAGAVLEAEDLEKYMNHPRVLGLGELMDYPSVTAAEGRILRKVLLAKDAGKVVDGHGPIISGNTLNAYVAAGVRTEHECERVEEMLERLRMGMYIQIREGSAARNLSELVKAVTKENLRRCLFCTDDRHPGDILTAGHIDNNVRLAMENGVPALSAIRMATLNAAECYHLYDRGAIAPGYAADIILVDNLRSFTVEKVFKAGKLVADDKMALFEPKGTTNSAVLDTVNFKPMDVSDLELTMTSDIARVIKLLPHSLVTEEAVRKVDVKDGKFAFSKHLDILKVAVIERHKATGNIGLGLIEDFGLKNGAIASTVAHDSHNLIVIGDSDENMMAAIEEIQRIGGGLTLVRKGKVLASLPLPIAGLMSDRPIHEMDDNLERMLELAYDKLGVKRDYDPFMTLAFMALPVIPALKLTDEGLFDVKAFSFTDLCVADE